MLAAVMYVLKSDICHAALEARLRKQQKPLKVWSTRSTMSKGVLTAGRCARLCPAPRTRERLIITQATFMVHLRRCGHRGYTACTYSICNLVAGIRAAMEGTREVWL